MLKKYYDLAKPGIVYGNSIAVIGGFFLASKGHINIWLFVSALVGSALVMGSGCVFNNFLDRTIDKRMARTKKRALVSGSISGPAALTYGAVLGVIGLALLLWQTNILTMLIGVAGLFFYVVVYGFAKRRTTHSTLVGSISGALPPVAGYCAVSGRLDLGALLLFLVLAFWQMPHFYAIATYRRDEYAAAKLPILTVVKGVKRAKIEMLLYIVGFIIASVLLWASGYAGVVYLVAVSLVGLYWLWLAVKGFQASNDDKWARGLFGFSLIVLLVFCFAISLNAWLI